MGIFDDLTKNLGTSAQRAQSGDGGQGVLIQAVMGMLAGGVLYVSGVEQVLGT